MAVPSFDPIEYINSPRWRHCSLGLGRMRMLLEEMGSPQDGRRFVHVAGTNGKGSVCAYIDSMLRASGAKVGLFTSPYIETFEERIRVDGANIPMQRLAEVALSVRDAAEKVESKTGEHPTEFELMCAVALEHFRMEGCDIAVMEVGLGGRLDATNVIDPELCVITRIGLDHTDILGKTLEEVAAEKAGILKNGVPVLSWPQDAPAMKVVEERCKSLDCALTAPDFEALRTYPARIGEGIRRFRYRGEEFQTGMLASYQPMNAALAIEAARILEVPEDAVREGVSNARWPGRFEVLGTSPLVIVDGSHNPQGAKALAETLEDFEIERASFIMGVLSDKDFEGVISQVVPLAESFVVYTPENPRALPAEDIARIVGEHAPCIPVHIAANAGDAMRAAMQKEGPEGVIVAFGTLYSIGELKAAYSSLGVSTP